jgi:hypothetical protein
MEDYLKKNTKNGSQPIFFKTRMITSRKMEDDLQKKMEDDIKKKLRDIIKAAH